MAKATLIFLVKRTCTYLDERGVKQERTPLSQHREKTAYVLLGDPGAGKTKTFEVEAEESNGHYIKAREFITFEVKEEYRGKTLFIDGLDEVRAGGGDGRSPLDQIRKNLDQLGRPRFRLSCREGYWMSANDKEALKKISPNGTIVELHLDPLTDEDIIAILRDKKSISKPGNFVKKAQQLGLNDLLRNPQVLDLLVKATGDNEWPNSRKEIYEMACQQLLHEDNSEHRQAKRDIYPSDADLLDAASYLCAIQLLSGIEGYALDSSAINAQYAGLQDLTNLAKLPLKASLQTNLFQSGGIERRTPIHRTVAEYLGARHLAHRIEKQSLPFVRVLALMTAQDGGIFPDLRGLAAWLSVYCLSERTELIKREPLSIVLYGDVQDFSVAEKKLILEALQAEAKRFPGFRADDRSSSPFGALGTDDMVPTFRNILASSSHDDASQELLSCVLDAIRYGEPMPALAEPLQTIVRDRYYKPRIRASALKALMHVTPDNHSQLLKLTEEIRTGKVEDRDDEILGVLLTKLYPDFISPEKIFDYLHAPKNKHWYGSYFTFWTYELSKKTSRNAVAILIDQLVQRHMSLKDILDDYPFKEMPGNLLARGLETHGDNVTDERLYHWLGVGLDQYSHPQLKRQDLESVAQWLAHHPNRYKAVMSYGISLCAQQETVGYCLSKLPARFYGATPPSDIVWLEPFIVDPINDWKQNHALEERKWELEQKKRKGEIARNFRQHLTAIQNGSAHPRLLHDLAQAYNGLLIEAKGKRPRERLEDFFDGDVELVDAVYQGFRNSLTRNDLPTVTEIIDLETKGRMHFIRAACLIGMELNTLPLEDEVLKRMVAFYLTRLSSNDEPAWFQELIHQRPGLIAEVFITYALAMLRAGKEYLTGTYSLAHHDNYAEVARLALPALLEGFPPRASKKQLTHTLDDLLKGALRYLDRKVLASIIKRKLALKSLEEAQRVYWLTCGLMISPRTYATALNKHIGKSAARKRYLADFLHSRGKYAFSFEDLPEATLALLIKILAPTCQPEHPSGTYSVTPAMNTAEVVYSLIQLLSRYPTETATQELENLLSSSNLSHWNPVLSTALHSQRILKRKAAFQPPSATEIARALNNLEPASAADLAALTFDCLTDIARKIHDGESNDYRQYWSYAEKNKTLINPKPKSEDDCRDALLSDMKERLAKLKIAVHKEGYYAKDKRADIRVSFGGAHGFNIPIEIKKDNHRDLWTAIHDQLPQYTRDPGAEGYGIYLVFWFGGKGMPVPPGGKKLNSPQELADRLRQTLKPEEQNRIFICVIDCALPTTL